MKTATTNKIKVSVEPRFIECDTAENVTYFQYSYTIEITNESDETIVLRKRHWKIDDPLIGQHEVKGDGVVGLQPSIEPGHSFVYVSGCRFISEFGTMHGHFYLERHHDKKLICVKIPRFTLEFPPCLN